MYVWRFSHHNKRLSYFITHFKPYDDTPFTFTKKTLQDYQKTLE